MGFSVLLRYLLKFCSHICKSLKNLCAVRLVICKNYLVVKLNWSLQQSEGVSSWSVIAKVLKYLRQGLSQEIKISCILEQVPVL